MKNIASSLGTLEEEIMQVLWKEERATVRLVFDILKKKRNIAYTTVMTIMTRLYTKGILQRELHENGSYMYTPTQSKEKFLDKISEQVIKNLIKNCGEVAVARFIDIVEAGNFKKSAEWRKRLQKIK
jgi:predicted transcriptional regulator